MTDFFPPRPAATPTIYAFASTHPDHAGLLKVGYTERIAADRIAEQFPSGVNPYRIELIEPAMRSDGSGFTDHDIHRYLRARGIKNTSHEWFKCTVAQVRAAIVAVRERTANVEDRTLSFGLRPEQREAVEMTADYFEKAKTEQPGHTPHFLWNAKMRFGKTFAAYQLAKKMGWKKVLVLTFKPAVVHAWSEDLQRHIDFEGWQFITRDGELTYEQANKKRPIVCFGSFQDFLQRTPSGAIKPRNEWAHETEWDCVILDEYHYGAWRENAKGLFGADEEDTGEVAEEVTKVEAEFDESILPIKTGQVSADNERRLVVESFLEIRLSHRNSGQLARAMYGEQAANCFDVPMWLARPDLIRVHFQKRHVRPKLDAALRILGRCYHVDPPTHKELIDWQKMGPREAKAYANLMCSRGENSEAFAVLTERGGFKAKAAGEYIDARRRRLAGLCPKCGYDLRATPDRCPECGQVTLSAASDRV